MKFYSIFSKLLTKHLEEKYKICTKNYIKKTAIALTSFDMYCVKMQHIPKKLTKGLVYDWLSQQSCKSSCFQNQCKIAIRQFAIYMLENGKQAYVLPFCNPKTQPAETVVFKSCLAKSISELVESKRSRGYKYGPLNEYGILKRIDAFCINERLAKEELPRWFVEKWSEKINNEGQKSRANRIVVIRQLALHMLKQGKEVYIAETIPFPHNPFPYIPDENEMSALLAEIDSQKHKHPWPNYTLPVLFRLLLTSGLRISEACSLKTECIEFSSNNCCEIYINNAKGHKDRKIYLSGNILIILQKFNEKMSFMFPNREWFFPGNCRPREEHLSAGTARRYFNIAREAVFDSGLEHKFTVHCLRHVYIIWTLRRWRKEQLDVEKMLPYLSKHLGHSSIQETFTYYNHYNQDYEHITKDSEYFESIIPGVQYDT